MLDQLFFHRIQHLERFCTNKSLKELTHSETLNIPTSKELSAYHKGQLSLFPKESGNTFLKWTRDKVSFVELFVTIYESKAILGKNDQPVSKKDFLEVLMWFFNIRISQWSRLLNAAMDRKIKRESPYLQELSQLYNEMVNRRI